MAEYAAGRFGVRRSRYAWGRWLRRHNFTPQRPARRAYQQDPADLARWRAEVYPGIAAEARRAGAEVHWLDETGLRTDHNPGTGYAPRGRPPVARVSGRPHRVNAISTLTSAGVLRFSVFAGRFTAAVLVAFLGRLLRGTAGPVFLVLDGHPVYRSRKVRAWVAERSDRLRPFFLPPYCPELNPTEYLNNWVKGTVPPGEAGHDPGRTGRPGPGLLAGGAAAAAAGPAVLPSRAGHLRRITGCRSFAARGNMCIAPLRS